MVLIYTALKVLIYMLFVLKLFIVLYKLGILNIFGYEEQFIMHGVHMIFNGERGSAWRDEQSRRSKIVFIGKNLNADEMDSDFLSCRANLTATNIFTTINFIGSSEEEADKSLTSDKKKL